MAIVTGGARGLGRATSALPAKEDAYVAVADIEDGLVIEAVKGISNAGGSARYFHMDVTCEEDISQVCHEAGEEYGRIDTLVNNAGISGFLKPTHEISVSEWGKVLEKGSMKQCLPVPLYQRQGSQPVLEGHNLQAVYPPGWDTCLPSFCVSGDQGGILLFFH